jgi:hypothetical protein
MPLRPIQDLDELPVGVVDYMNSKRDAFIAHGMQIGEICQHVRG